MNVGEMDRGRSVFHPLFSPYEIREEEFPTNGSFEQQVRFLLKYVVIAPSTHNTQPWRFLLTPEGVDIYADYTRRLPVVDPANRELLMSIGAAVFNLRVAAARFGFQCEVGYNHSDSSERPLVSAALTPVAHPGAREADLLAYFPFLLTRHTNRTPFLQSRLPKAVLQQFDGIDAASQASLTISTDGQKNSDVGELVAKADRVLLADPLFRNDLAEWIRPNNTDKGDGITIAALGLGDHISNLGGWPTKVVDASAQRATIDRNLCAEAPGLFVVASEDAVTHWTEAGELMERVLLALMKEGLQYSYFNMPVQVPELRRELRSMLGLSLWPQLLLRVGYSLLRPPVTPRRPLEDMLMTTRL